MRRDRCAFAPVRAEKFARRAGPGGARAVVAESELVKHQADPIEHAFAKLKAH